MSTIMKKLPLIWPEGFICNNKWEIFFGKEQDIREFIFQQYNSEMNTNTDQKYKNLDSFDATFNDFKSNCFLNNNDILHR